jgi:hypothetical protein
MPIILATWEAEMRRIIVQSQPGQIVQETLSRKYPKQNRAGRVGQVVKRLPSKHEALNSNPSITQKKKKVYINYAIQIDFRYCKISLVCSVPSSAERGVGELDEREEIQDTTCLTSQLKEV